jgi:oxygen-independent coproporphyrinogen-3 oxidase
VAFSLYIHIPYCRSKCPYCDFNSHAAAAWPEQDYTQALLAELGRRAQEPPWAGERIATIFFGGGTPSLFATSSIAEIIALCEKLFGIEPGAEVTLEANPGTIDGEKLLGLRCAGVNRISLGAQSFKDETLRFLGRIHDAEQTRRCARLAREAGFEHLNLDLIFAVPGQTFDDLRHDIDEAAALEPDHISCYNLTFEEGTAFYVALKRGRIRPLSDSVQARMYALARKRLAEHGYAMYEISNYARAGGQCRHNLAYWRGQSFLGVGAGAHSYARRGLGGRRWWNERAPTVYIERALRAGIAESGGEFIDERTAAGEFMFLNLRLREGFVLAEFEHRFGRSFEAFFGATAARLFASGLLVREGGRVRLSERGLELADGVAAEFL